LIYPDPVIEPKVKLPPAPKLDCFESYLSLSCRLLVTLVPERVTMMMPGLLTVPPSVAIPGFELVML